MAQILLHAGRIAVEILLRTLFSSPVTDSENGFGAVSRCKLGRSRITIMVQEFDCMQRCESGFNYVLKAVLKAVVCKNTV
jgi:hypothetical protein